MKEISVRIALGQDVFTHDGTKVGKVDRLVLNDRTHRVEQIVVHKGVFFVSDKLIDRVMIERIDGDGVHLTLDAADERKLPDFYSGQYYEWIAGSAFPYLESMSWGYAGMLLVATPPTPSREYPGTDNFFELAPFDQPADRPESNLSVTDDVIGEGAEVVSSDEHKLGHVHGASYDQTGTLTGLVVRSGLVHKHDVEIPAAWVTDTGDHRIRLNVSASEAEKSAAMSTEQG